MESVAIHDMDAGIIESVPVFYDDFGPIHYGSNVIDLASIVGNGSHSRYQECDTESEDFYSPFLYDLVRI